MKQEYLIIANFIAFIFISFSILSSWKIFNNFISKNEDANIFKDNIMTIVLCSFIGFFFIGVTLITGSYSFLTYSEGYPSGWEKFTLWFFVVLLWISFSLMSLSIPRTLARKVLKNKET